MLRQKDQPGLREPGRGRGESAGTALWCREAWAQGQQHVGGPDESGQGKGREEGSLVHKGTEGVGRVCGGRVGS